MGGDILAFSAGAVLGLLLLRLAKLAAEHTR
jgi:hypothetical protein